MADTRCIQGLERVPASAGGYVLTIGNFDGVHLGHRLILQRARALADAEGAPLAAMTFEPPPDLVLRPQDAPQRITPLGPKCALLRKAGADWVLVARADRAFLAKSPADFIDEIICRRLSARHVVEGDNFFFGHDRSGNIDTLRLAGSKKGFLVHVVEPVAMELPEGPQRVSSSLVRRLVAAGRMEDAARCLGRPFALYGDVVSGQGHGRLLDFPTANIQPDQQVVPADGVYAGKAWIGEAAFKAAISVGNKPTLGPAAGTCVEAFLIDARGDYYGREMSLSFHARLRGQERFQDAPSLRAQIAKDVQRVREIVP